MIGEITYTFVPDDWNQDRFLALGGFTIVFLNYNKAKFIKRSVASALNQDYPLLEIFFMDDASTDGSGDEMERLVKKYRGRHKVAVVRNTENQYITGQWNIVSKLATGIWFGMFCGDDEAFPDRVSQCARLIARYPHLKGMCTSGIEINLLSGDVQREIAMGYSAARVRGSDSVWSIVLSKTAVVGATAFWHRSLFENPLPRVPFDDVLLRWILQLRCAGTRDYVWVWETNLITVRYAIGEGVSTDMRKSTSRQGGFSLKWREEVLASRRFLALMERTWRGIQSYYSRNGATGTFHALARYEIVGCGIKSSGTLRRIRLIPSVVWLLLDRLIPWPARKMLLSEFLRRLSLEFFGLGFASYIAQLRNLRQ